MATKPNTPKSHHFVAQMHGARFTDESGYFYVFNKHAGKILRQKPKGAFAETHLHTKIDAEGNHDTSLETELSTLEGAANSVIHKIVAAALASRGPNLTVTEKETWDHYFYIQWKRTPDVHAKIEILAGEPGALDELFAQFKAHHPQSAEEIDRLRADPAAIQRIVRSGTVDAIRFTPGNVLDVLSRRALVVAKIRTAGASFAIGSQPLVRFGGDLREEQTELWLPISSQIMVGMGKYGAGQHLVHLEDVSAIAQVNHTTAFQSSSFAAADKSLVISLARSIGAIV